MQHAQALAGGSVAAGQAPAGLGQPLPRRRELVRILQLKEAPAATGLDVLLQGTSHHGHTVNVKQALACTMSQKSAYDHGRLQNARKSARELPSPGTQCQQVMPPEAPPP